MTRKLCARVILRNDKEERWNEVNPVLMAGEFAVSFMGGGYGFKLGDGTTHYNDLPFVSIGQGFEEGKIYTAFGAADLIPVKDYPAVNLTEFERVIG